ncbi:MAG: hypothetical protein ABEJ68_10995 [Halobacteriaceae archaeon]
MHYRCRLCGRTCRDSTTATRHVTRDHGEPDFGWHVERVPESRHERPIAAASNAPLRAREWWRRHAPT